MVVKLAGNDIPVIPCKPFSAEVFRKQCMEGGDKRAGVMIQFRTYA